MVATLTAPAPAVVLPAPEVIDLPAAIEVDGFGMASCTWCGADIWDAPHWDLATADAAVDHHLADPATPRSCGE